jgi:hypothetical protein
VTAQLEPARRYRCRQARDGQCDRRRVRCRPAHHRQAEGRHRRWRQDAAERFLHFSASRRNCTCCMVSMPAIISAWAEVARHRRHPICSRRYRLGSHRRRLIARRHRMQTPRPKQQFLPFRMFCPKICLRRSRNFRTKSSIDCSPQCSLSRSDVAEGCPSPLRTHASSESNRLP